MARKALVVKCKKQRKFKVQEYNRCQTCGRPRSIYRKFMLCRICFREHAHKGVIPGITKSSW